MLALGQYRHNRCPGCGGDLAVTTDGRHDGRFKHEPPVQCFRCVAFSQSYKVYADEPHPSSFIHQVPQAPQR